METKTGRVKEMERVRLGVEGKRDKNGLPGCSYLLKRNAGLDSVDITKKQHRARSKCSVTVFEIEQSLPSLSEVVDLAYAGQNARRLSMGSRSLKHSIVCVHTMYKGCPNCHS